MKKTLILVTLAVLVLSLGFASATTYTIKTYSDNSYTIEDDSFIQGESVYLKGTSSTGYPGMRVSYFNTTGARVHFCQVASYGSWSSPPSSYTSYTCAYALPNDAPEGTWTVKLETGTLSGYTMIWTVRATDTFEVTSPNIPTVPEFGAIVGVLTALGALGVFFLVRKK